jgi:hypothetical protein
MKQVAFATNCWENDWKHILLNPDYLPKKQIGFHCYPFAEKILIINNVLDLPKVKEAAQVWVDKGVLTRFVVAQDVLPFFGLRRSDFNDWQYYNALGPLNAIYECQSEYLLYVTGDVYLKKPVSWIEKTLAYMERDPKRKVGNLVWNDNWKEARRESYRGTWNFLLSGSGFSDQMFLVKTEDFRAPIYGEVREDGNHFPRGDVWEKRVFSYMKNHGWERVICRRGSYTHENIGSIPL